MLLSTNMSTLLSAPFYQMDLLSRFSLKISIENVEKSHRFCLDLHGVLKAMKPDLKLFLAVREGHGLSFSLSLLNCSWLICMQFIV